MNRRLDEIGSELERELGALLGSVNFSGYSDRARLRGDDLAVRSVAGAELLSARGLLANAIVAWWKARVGEPTREQPFPEPALSAKLRTLRAFEQSLAAREAELRGASAPDFDRVWSARADGTSVLHTLLSHDRSLVACAQRLSAAARSLTPDDLDSGDPCAALRGSLDDFDAIVRERRAFLQSL